MDMLEAPTKPCHNCRRRRLRCDRSVPSCNKCSSTGQECLGYGKLFKWAGGVATRGKLAGKTHGKPACNKPTPPRHDTSTPMTPESAMEWPATPRDDFRDREMRLVHVSASNSPLPYGDDSDQTPFNATTPWTLVDPVFQDMDYPYRHYLSYFTTRVCKDLVACDVPAWNPFRRLIPLTKAHPVLQHIIVATSAAHMSNLTRSPWCPDPHPTSTGEIAYPSGADASHRARVDFLVAKQKALRLLHSAVQNIESTGSDVVLAAVYFFINVELIESGKHGWKAHLEGAGRIMSLLQPVDTANESLRDYVMSDCIVYYILASAFKSDSPAQTSFFESAQISTILQRASSNSYFCCPSEILQILLEAARLSHATEDDTDPFSAAETTAKGLLLMQRAQSLDIQAWANEARIIEMDEVWDGSEATPESDSPVMPAVGVRLHVGNAHRTASCLYILQAIPSVIDVLPPDTVTALEQDLIQHLSLIPEADPNFKATTWPTFIAGAQARDPNLQAWVAGRLRGIMRMCPWGFISTAMDTLNIIWGLDKEGTGQRRWVQTLRDPDMNFLIV